MNKHVEAQKSQKGKQENVPCKKTEKVKYKEQGHMLIIQLCSIYCIGVSYVLNRVQQNTVYSKLDAQSNIMYHTRYKLKQSVLNHMHIGTQCLSFVLFNNAWFNGIQCATYRMNT